MKSVKAALQEKNSPPEVITAFEKGAQAYVKEHLLPNFKDFEFYTGESMNPDGMYVSCSTVLNQDGSLTISTGLSSSTTVRMVSPPTSSSGSTVFPR